GLAGKLVRELAEEGPEILGPFQADGFRPGASPGEAGEQQQCGHDGQVFLHPFSSWRRPMTAAKEENVPQRDPKTQKIAEYARARPLGPAPRFPLRGTPLWGNLREGLFSAKRRDRARIGKIP